jgi:hypothetical protein
VDFAKRSEPPHVGCYNFKIRSETTTLELAEVFSLSSSGGEGRGEEASNQIKIQNSKFKNVYSPSPSSAFTSMDTTAQPKKIFR